MLRFLVFCAMILGTIAFMSGCGGGGGGSAQPPSGVKILNVVPDASSSLQLSNWTLTVPAGAVSQSGQMQVSEGQSPAGIRSDFVSVNQTPYVIIAASESIGGNIRIDITAARSRSVVDGIYFFVTLVDGQWHKLAQSQTNGTELIIAGNKFIDGTISGIIGWGPIKPISTSATIVQLAGDPNADRYTMGIVLVPGLTGTPSDLQQLADYIVGHSSYKVVFGFDYDYRADIAVSGRNLYDQMNALYSRWENVDIFGHSEGGIVCRYMIKRVGRPKNVRNLYGVCVPNCGSLWGNVGEFVNALQDMWFNTSNTNVGIALADAPAASELALNSSFLRDFNNYHPDEPTQVIYTMVAAIPLDTVVGLNSELGVGIDWTKETSTLFQTMVLEGSHDSLVRSQSGIAKLIPAVFGQPAGVTGIIALSLDNGYTAEYNLGDTWDYRLIIKNWSNSSGVLTDLSMKKYDSYGNWQGPVLWYNPATGEFDQDYHQWNKPIASREQLSIHRIVPVDMSLPEKERSMSVNYNLRCTIGGYNWIQCPEYPHAYNGWYPADANARSVK